jgi:hypothetical protein
MTSNPFEPLVPRPAPALLSPAPRIAHGVALAAALAACIAWAVGWLYAMVSQPELEFARSGWLVGPLGLTGLAQEIALAGLTGLLTTRFCCEREAIGGHRRPLWLLAGVFIALEPVHGLAAWVEAVRNATGMTAPALINLGLAGIGLRGAIRD